MHPKEISKEDIKKTLETGMELLYEKRRQATFKSWIFPKSAACNASKLAEAGFLFTGSEEELDSVTCFMCNKQLDSWDEDDDPWAEHLKHSPNCLFAKLNKPEGELTLGQFIDVRTELVVALLTRMKDEYFNEIEKVMEAFKEVLSELR